MYYDILYHMDVSRMWQYSTIQNVESIDTHVAFEQIGLSFALWLRLPFDRLSMFLSDYPIWCLSIRIPANYLVVWTRIYLEFLSENIQQIRGYLLKLKEQTVKTQFLTPLRLLKNQAILILQMAELCLLMAHRSFIELTSGFLVHHATLPILCVCIFKVLSCVILLGWWSWCIHK